MCYSCYSYYSCASRTSSTRGGAGFSRRTTAEMHPMTLASSGTPSTQPVAVALALLAAILGKYAETEQTTKNSRRNREAIQPMADSRGCLF